MAVGSIVIITIGTKFDRTIPPANYCLHCDTLLPLEVAALMSEYDTYKRYNYCPYCGTHVDEPVKTETPV
jgi:DNA-directed RNA polymerase subunit RPC12/RpoP